MVAIAPCRRVAGVSGPKLEPRPDRSLSRPHLMIEAGWPAPGAVRMIVVLRLARENSQEYQHVHCELLVLHIKVAASTVWQILTDAGIDLAPDGDRARAARGSPLPSTVSVDAMRPRRASGRHSPRTTRGRTGGSSWWSDNRFHPMAIAMAESVNDSRSAPRRLHHIVGYTTPRLGRARREGLWCDCGGYGGNESLARDRTDGQQARQVNARPVCCVDALAWVRGTRLPSTLDLAPAPTS